MRHSFESEALERVDLEKAYTKAEEVLADRIQESDFSDTYPSEEITADKDKITELKSKYEGRQTPGERETKKEATVFEAIVFEQGELGQWFDENAFTTAASEYDDYINGVDLLVEFRRPEHPDAEHLALGIDVTFTTDTTDKFDRLRQQIDDGKLAEMKYFPGSRGESRGPKDKIPEVIIGVERRTVEELRELWLEKDNLALEKHRVQIMILLQIEAQLTTFSSYASSENREDLADIYESRLKIIRKILAKKNELYKRVALELDTDSVHYAITSYMRRWQRVINESLEKQGEDSPLSLKELMQIQNKLIISSGMDPIEWINKYAELLRNEIQDPKIRQLTRSDPEAGKQELIHRLYEEAA